MPNPAKCIGKIVLEWPEWPGAAGDIESRNRKMTPIIAFIILVIVIVVVIVFVALEMDIVVVAVLELTVVSGCCKV